MLISTFINTLSVLLTLVNALNMNKQWTASFVLTNVNKVEQKQ